jgi:hypothetical protein
MRVMTPPQRRGLLRTNCARSAHTPAMACLRGFHRFAYRAAVQDTVARASPGKLRRARPAAPASFIGRCPGAAAKLKMELLCTLRWPCVHGLGRAVNLAR